MAVVWNNSSVPWKWFLLAEYAGANRGKTFPHRGDAKILIQMSPRKKDTKKQPPQPERRDFNEWKTAFEKSLYPRTPEAKALAQWMSAKANYWQWLGDVERAQRESLLMSVYEMTLPNLPTGMKKRGQEAAVFQLKELLPVAKVAAAVLKACGSHVTPLDGTPALDLSDLLFHLEKTSVLAEGALLFLDRKNMRSADALSHCAVFLSTLADCGVAEPAALALTRKIMCAHGYNEADELQVLSKDSGRAGTPRKRRKEVINTYFDVVESFLELKRKAENRPPFNPKLYRRKQD